uniref:Calcium channel, voltage-dependent, alpha 2/delta subunit 4b n=1 Tax=Cyprinus carpio TaxID=7962 RepID=A0A8C1QEJ9_CYPCA
SEQINAIASKYSGAVLLQKKLKDVEPIIRIEDVDGARLVLEFADEIERMLGSKMKSVKVSLKYTAEDADLYHEYNASLQFDYFNALLVNTMDEEGNFIELGGEFPLEENEHFNKLSVNTLMSDIQVPTNVYNKDPNILNGVYMSEALNDVFISNFQKDPTLTWQYFGSSAGFFRLYPGIKWTPDSNGVVSFDCRNRNWYIQAATSPKDIVILVDVSGSMKGLKMTIAKHTINTILDTLGENDFVNVIAYTDYVRYVEPCFKGTLVQADLDNREHFKLLVEELHMKGEAKVKKAMKESFRILGSLCNQAIMLITDGAMEDFQSVFEEFNWPDKKVRVFTYLIGRDMTFSENIKWIACNNKGYYTHISTLADVQENVMEYLHVLSRPMVINHDHDIIWTEAYMDSVVTHSLLLMTSVAMPVFSKKKETLSHGILLGVVGTDVPLLEVMKLAPRYKLGAHGYAFLITNNGYILAHPDLRPLYVDGKKLKPKPNYNSVDLSEAEWEDTEDSLRTAMVKGETGTLTLDVRAAVDKGKRPLFLKNEYFYTTINETPFSFGMVLTRGHGQYMFFGNVSVEEGETFLTPVDKENLFTVDHFPIWYRLAAENKPGQFFFYASVCTSGSLHICLSMSVWVCVCVCLIIMGFRNDFILCYTVYINLNNPSLYAFVSVSMCPFTQVGKFFGEIDGSVMAQLLKSGLFKRVTLYDYQAMCKNAHHHTSGARPLFLLEFNICGLWHNDYVVDAHRQKKVELMQPCNTEYPGFMYDTSIRETNSIIKCGRCQKMFVLQQVPNSNLVMLVVQADCDCILNSFEHNATVKCNRMKSQKIRRRPESCHAYHPHENANDCGGACGIAVSLTLCFICLATSLALH